MGGELCGSQVLAGGGEQVVQSQLVAPARGAPSRAPKPAGPPAATGTSTVSGTGGWDAAADAPVAPCSRLIAPAGNPAAAMAPNPAAPDRMNPRLDIPLRLMDSS